MKPNDMLKIGELAKQTGCQVETIRYYEQEGLMPSPMRSDGNYRLYGVHHIERLQFIRNCRSLDMTLDEIRHLLAYKDAPEQSCGEVNAVLDTHIGHVTRRIEELQVLQKELEALRQSCSAPEAARDCGILQALSRLEEAAPKNLGTHKHGGH
jgi:Cd(II)/Pb(II)-responsive transcriptional regulator